MLKCDRVSGEEVSSGRKVCEGGTEDNDGCKDRERETDEFRLSL